MLSLTTAPFSTSFKSQAAIPLCLGSVSKRTVASLTFSANGNLQPRFFRFFCSKHLTEKREKEKADEKNSKYQKDSLEPLDYTDQITDHQDAAIALT